MTRPVFYCPTAAQARPGELVTVTGEEAHHLEVKRITAGESIDLVDGRGRRARGELVTCHGREASVRVREVIDERPSQPAIVIVQALVKGGREQVSVDMGTQIGADGVILWQAERSIVRWNSAKAAKAVEKLAATAREAAKVARRAYFPALSYASSLAELERAIADQARELTSVAKPRVELVVAHQDTSGPIEELPASVYQADVIAVIVGPEGGISDDELAHFTRAGAHRVLIGSTIMRSSTAAICALSILTSARRTHQRLESGETTREE